MHKRKQTLTLLEIMIALSLAAILLTVVFNLYRKVTISHLKLDKAKEQVLTNKFIQQRLSYIFTHLACDKPLSKRAPLEETLACYTTKRIDSKGVSLTATYDNGIDPEPSFCGKIKAELYLNQQNQLCLMTHSSSGITRKEILQTGLSKLEFKFFSPHVDPPEQEEWEPSQDELPSIVEMILWPHPKASPIRFAFFLPKG